MESIARARQLVKKYAHTVAVAGIDFEILENECFGFIGPNGAGKTTAMKMLYCFLPRTGGTLEVLGRDPSVHPELIKRDLGVIPQDTNLDTDLNVFENLTCYARYFGIPHAAASARAAELLDFVHLTEKRTSEIEELSSGMRRRLLIARGLINSPRLLILDEPTVGLDPQARHLIWNKLRELRAQNVTLILTTHYMDEAAELCDRVAVMDKGTILATGNPRELIRAHIGQEVLELNLTGIDPNAALAELRRLPVKVEASGQKLYIHCEDGRQVLHLLTESGYRHITRRPATLEDVFLTLTGRDLVD
ncbi:MAG: ABC transporter ATP-binding protein [Candidatus Aureabacteria bacterium]|nr:ABC transporter ATP-binding protein [Candidatus Auribacterota bacterium]